jgi:hypothetical protein
MYSGTVFKHPPIRLLALPPATMCFAIGVELLIIDVLRLAGVPAPCRISSLPMGAPLRPGIYAYIEDIVAVDGSGGTEFRQRLNLRYQASRLFRQMLHRLTLFWAIGSILISAVTTAIVFTIQRDAAYVVSFTHNPITTLTNSFRWAGPYHSYGPVCGPGSLFLGCRGASRMSAKSGRLLNGRHRG